MNISADIINIVNNLSEQNFLDRLGIDSQKLKKDALSFAKEVAIGTLTSETEFVKKLGNYVTKTGFTSLEKKFSSFGFLGSFNSRESFVNSLKDISSSINDKRLSSGEDDTSIRLYSILFIFACFNKYNNIKKSEVSGIFFNKKTSIEVHRPIFSAIDSIILDSEVAKCLNGVYSFTKMNSVSASNLISLRREKREESGNNSISIDNLVYEDCVDNLINNRSLNIEGYRNTLLYFLCKNKIISVEMRNTGVFFDFSFLISLCNPFLRNLSGVSFNKSNKYSKT